MPFDQPPFRPHPLVRGGHLQTIVGTYWRAKTSLASKLHRVPLTDGDAVALHEDRLAAGGGASSQGTDGRAAAVLVHGLGGSHTSGYMQRLSAKLLARGVRVFRMELRGCGAGMAWARNPLHAGRSEDIRAVFEFVIAHCPGAAIHLVGFSMGANMVLK